MKDALEFGYVIDLIKVTEYSGLSEDDIFDHDVEDVRLDINVYTLKAVSKHDELEETELQDPEAPQARKFDLPSEFLDGLFEQ